MDHCSTVLSIRDESVNSEIFLDDRQTVKSDRGTLPRCVSYHTKEPTDRRTVCGRTAGTVQMEAGPNSICPADPSGRRLSSGQSRLRRPQRSHHRSVMSLRREPNNRSKPTNWPSLSVSQRESPSKVRKFPVLSKPDFLV